MRPVRLQLSRRAGFDLQALSRKLNGRDAVKVTRPGKWGNPFSVAPNVKPGTMFGQRYIAVPSAEDAVACFREMLRVDPRIAEEARKQLAGKNLSCWCKHPKPGMPDVCHAAVLLEIANAPSCEAIE